MNARRLILLIPALCLALAASAQTELKTFQLKHRDAAEILTTLRPLLDPSAGISGSGYTLIVRGTAQDLEETENLLKTLDVAQRNLLITVRLAEAGEIERQGIRADGSSDDGKIAIGRGGAPRVRVYATRQNDDGRGSEQLRVLEGQWARIQRGQDLPIPQQSIAQSADGSLSVQQSIDYRDVSSGFEVRPRLNGDRVTLAVRPYQARPADSGGGAIDTAQIDTTVSGKLGEWIALGGVNEEQAGHNRGTVYATRERDARRLQIWVRVEALD